MKIMQIVPSFEVGGAETMCAGLCKALAAMGHQVVAASLSSIPTQITRQLAEAGVDVRYLDKKPGMDLGCVGRLRALICRERPQVLHTHLHALKYAALTFTGVPMIHTIHNQAEQEAVSLDQKIGRFLFRQGKALPVALSPQIRDSIVRLYGLPEGQIPVVRNGIDLSRCQVKTDYSLHDPVELIHVGRFYPQKNHEAILDALVLLNQRGLSARVRFFGEGPRMEEIQEKAASLGIDSQVRFEGVTDNVFVPMSQSDLFVLPSRWEGLPMTVIEAMGTGLPVIASDVGGLRDMVEDGKSGILIEPTAQALAQAVMTLARDEETRQAMGEHARRAAQAFGAEEMARRYEELYEQKGRKP